MTPKVDDMLVQAAMMVRERAPDAWDQYVQAVRQYAVIAATTLVRSPKADLETNQGKAQALNDLSLLLQEAPQRYDAMRARRVNQ